MGGCQKHDVSVRHLEMEILPHKSDKNSYPSNLSAPMILEYKVEKVKKSFRSP
jgi:hypothetical protein